MDLKRAKKRALSMCKSHAQEEIVEIIFNALREQQLEEQEEKKKAERKLDYNPVAEQDVP